VVQSIQDRVNEVLNLHRFSSDKQKRNIALQILADLELFMMFCRVVEQQNKNNSKNLLTQLRLTAYKQNKIE
jgi:hypothetical protein